jgi:acetyltransferase-like isoleucine patch superfamily enzyme
VIHDSADVDPRAAIDPSATIWGLAQIRDGASIGAECIIGRGAYIDVGVTVGSRVKVQNFALIYAPATIGEGAFVGPGAILTNDHTPRAISPDGTLKEAGDWEAVGVTIGDGASVGAGAICVAPVRIGAWAMIGAGAVVTSDVPGYGLVVGSPARRVGWVGQAGYRLQRSNGSETWKCPITGGEYQEVNGELIFVGSGV